MYTDRMIDGRWPEWCPWLLPCPLYCPMLLNEMLLIVKTLAPVKFQMSHLMLADNWLNISPASSITYI